MYLSLAFGIIPYTFSLFVIVNAPSVNDITVPAVITVIDPSFLLPVLLFALVIVLLYYIWCLRKQITYINRTGKDVKDARLNMISNISQEVRTPLNAIIGFSEQLSYTALDCNQRELLGAVENAAGMLMQIQQNIQELGWLQKGELHLDTYPFSPYKIFDTVTRQLSSRAYNKRLQFEITYEGDQQLEVTGDGDRLTRILACLVENAIKYTDAGSVHCHMQVEKQASGNIQVSIQVRDTGSGITPERLPYIFDQYMYNGTPVTGTLHGAGLGLALVRALVELHNGQLTVESTPGKGSCFSCSLSYQPLPPPQTIIVTQQELSQTTGQLMKDRYILVADDQEMNLALMDRILTRWQCRFDKASDGVAAYELFVCNNYDMVLLDLQMPRMTGVEVVKRIREDKEPTKAHIPVLALTADTTMPANQEFIDAGFDDYLLKPFREKDIYNVIIRHLRPLINIPH
ncbi:hybrid sensor histidine kinase/response regulator [Chitinophaga ginsengisoli]|uniref:histidine kinase n=1 Tax=Chitinophaga ginsengisoli TaxID=363837 RepID=A0A2P8GGZ6_9BACT|nr:response regulator [Chitinophaga ginsengisoli]PSL33241.1 phospho-acceptor domain-containing protein [Chitinophaga ginsengisoli]